MNSINDIEFKDCSVNECSLFFCHVKNSMSETILHKRSSDYRSGILFGLFLIFSLANLTIGLVILFVYVLSFLHQRVPRDTLVIVILIFAQVVWTASINLLFKNTSFILQLQQYSINAILLLMLVTPLSIRFINGMLKSLICLFLVDFLFNLSVLFFGIDLLGRGAQLRADDYLPRVGGLFGHPFYSANISTIAFISGLFLRKNWIIFLSAMALLLNGTFRSPLILIIAVATLIVLKLKLRIASILIFSLLIVSCVVVVTAYSANPDASYVSGNYLRIVAWSNAVQNIVASPFFGSHSFKTGTFDFMSIDTIVDYGIAESLYLQVAQDFGIPCAIIIFMVYFLIMRRNVLFFYNVRNNYQYRATAVLSVVWLVDSFYGTFSGSVLTTFFFGALCLSMKNEKKIL